MAVGLSAAIANDILDALCKNLALTTLPAAAFYVQLHTGDPGATGTAANVAGNATRKEVAFDAAASGATSNTTAVSWSTSEVDTSETYTHWSGWTAASSGTFLASGTITANAVTSGDEFQFPAGSFDLSFTVAS